MCAGLKNDRMGTTPVMKPRKLEASTWSAPRVVNNRSSISVAPRRRARFNVQSMAGLVSRLRCLSYLLNSRLRSLAPPSPISAWPMPKPVIGSITRPASPKCPSRPIGCAYDVRQVARAPCWADLNRGARPFTQAPGLVEGGHDMSCGIVPNLVEVRNPPSDIGESEPVVCRPGADRISRRRIDLATLDRQTVPVRVEPVRVEGE